MTITDQLTATVQRLQRAELTFSGLFAAVQTETRQLVAITETVARLEARAAKLEELGTNLVASAIATYLVSMALENELSVRPKLPVDGHGVVPSRQAPEIPA